MVLLPLVAACGRYGTNAAAPEQVTVTLSEWTFVSSRTTFTAGVPYRFVLRNRGAAAHEWAVVPRGAVDERQLLTEVEGDDLPPSATATVEFTFPRAGQFDFTCFMRGHLAAGMKLPVTVTDSKGA